MKRLIPYIALTMALAAFLSSPITSTTYTYVVKELSNTFEPIQYFAAGLTATGGDLTAATGDITATAGDINVTAGSVNVPAGNVNVDAGNVTISNDGAIILDGVVSDTYMKNDVDTGCIFIYKESTLTMEICSGYGVMFCTDDSLENAPAGAFCYDAATQAMIFKDGGGIWQQ